MIANVINMMFNEQGFHNCDCENNYAQMCRSSLWFPRFVKIVRQFQETVLGCGLCHVHPHQRALVVRLCFRWLNLSSQRAFDVDTCRGNVQKTEKGEEEEQHGPK